VHAPHPRGLPSVATSCRNAAQIYSALKSAQYASTVDGERGGDKTAYGLPRIGWIPIARTPYI
jgi:hypothetical protein